MKRNRLKNSIITAGFLLPFCLFSTLNTVWAQANHALIIGVSKYDNLDESKWLSGPQNDVVLVREFLQKNTVRAFQEENIKVLADGIEGSSPATLNAIRKSMAELADKAQPDDFIYLHFSGHGSQAPAIDPSSELDGLDELFLPADIGAWDETTGVVENALVDDEIGEMIDAIRQKGAHVWAVFDSCHSGTVTRATGITKNENMEVSRKLSPSALGVPQKVMGQARVRTRGADKTTKVVSAIENFDTSIELKTGSFVAFYAAQTNQTTPEMPLPEGSTTHKSYGLFTFTLLEAMAQNPGASYGQLAQEILRLYAGDNRPNPTPLFEGDLDLGIFSTEQVDNVQQWPIKQTAGRVEINAGLLHGLAKGEMLGLVEKAGQKTVSADVKFEVSDITDLNATLIPVSDSFTILEDGQFARKIETQISYAFRVALPPREQRKGKIADLINGISTIEPEGLVLEVVETDENAVVQLLLEDDALWFIGKDGFLNKEGINKTPSISISDKSPDMLLAATIDNFIRMAKVNNLTKLGGIFRPSKMGVEVEFRAENVERETPLVINSSSISKLVPGDIIFMKANNTSRGPLDINVLYIGSDFSIEHIYNARLTRGDNFNLDLIDIGDSSFGRERIMVVATPAAPQSATQNLSWLAQSKLETTKGQRSGSNIASMLGEAGFSTVTRGGTRRTGNDGGIAQFMVEVVEELK